MKKENLKLKEMMEYVEHVPLNMVEASKVFEMEGDGRRNFDTPYVYFAMKTIRGLVKKGYDLHSFPKKFLNRFCDLHFNDAVNIMNIMYFKEDLEMNDIYKSVKAFYDFFNDDIDYDNDRFNAIKDYIIQDNDVNARLYRTILIIDINMLAGNSDMKFFTYLANADSSILEEHFNSNKYVFDETFNKNLFKAQLSYMKYYFEEKKKEKTK